MSNEWREHKGTTNKPNADALVEIILRNGKLIQGRTSSFDWHLPFAERSCDIVKYRFGPTPVEQSSGSHNDYYVADIANPKRLKPCRVECEDVIQALGMTFGEGEAFKAIWRGCAARMGNGKPGDTAIRNAEKVVHYGEYMKRDAQNEDGK